MTVPKKKSGGLPALLGITRTKYDTLTKAQKVKLIDKELRKLEGLTDSKSNVKRNKLNISRIGITKGPPKRKAGTTKKNPAKKQTAKKAPSGLSSVQKRRLIAAFTRIQKKAIKALPQLTAVGLVLEPGLHKTPRAYAKTKCLKTKATIYVAPEIAKLPKTQLDGVLMHEFGHAALEMTTGHGAGSYDAKERRADKMAEKLFGTKICYTAKGIETTGKGTRPRPAGLR